MILMEGKTTDLGGTTSDGIAPQVLCPYCRKMKEEVNA